MNKSVYALLLTTLLLVPSAKAQRLHKIIFGHTTDGSIGTSVQIDMERASNEIDEIAAFIDYEVVPYFYVGNDCSKENLENVLTNLSVSNNDVVIFYYSGHGGHSQGGLNDPWPQMCLNQPQIQSRYYPLRKVIETITAKRPHFSLILSDCCNKIDETGSVTVKSVIKGVKESTTIDEKTKKNYIDLFTHYSGVLPVTSSKLDQYSLGDDVDGGLFSKSFFDALYEGVSGTSVTWQSIMDNTKEFTLSSTDGKQEPSGDLSKIQYIGGSTTTTLPIGTTFPVGTTPVGSTTSLLEQGINDLLNNPDKESRIASVPSLLQKCFASSDVYVMTVGRNLTTVVDTEKAQTFLRRIALSNNLVKINIVKESKDSNGRCTYVKVHEVKK